MYVAPGSPKSHRSRDKKGKEKSYHKISDKDTDHYKSVKFIDEMSDSNHASGRFRRNKDEDNEEKLEDQIIALE